MKHSFQDPAFDQFNYIEQAPMQIENPESEELLDMEELPDGSAIFDFGSKETIQMEEEEDFYENIAEKIDEGKANSIAAQLLEGIEQDKESRQEWQNSYIKGMKQLGFKLEDFKDVPFMSACRAFDTTFSMSLLRFYAIIFPELFPEEGPSSTEILGQKDDFLQQIGDNIKDGLNYYLRETDRDYYPDSERLLMFLILVGSAFRKVYIDPILNRPVARFIDPNNFLINNNCVSILSSSRITHIEELNRKEIQLRMKSGFYRDIDIPSIEDNDDDIEPAKQSINKLQGIDLDTYDKKGLYYIYECHVDLDEIDGSNNINKKEGIQKPYIVTICKSSKKVLSIRRNWDKNDPTFKRIEYFIQYNFIPGFGIYGLGLTQLLGSNSIVLTSLLRQLVDAGTLENFPGGLIQKGIRFEKSSKAIGPTDWLPIETGGLPIQQVAMPMPYKGPSPVLKDLMNELSEKTRGIANTLETQIAEGNPNAPVGTTLALLEVSSKFQTAVFSSLRKSLGNELTLIYHLFKQTVSQNPFKFKMPGKMGMLTPDQFIDEIIIIPNSDPKLTTSAQRILYAEAKIRMAQSAPQIHDLREVYKGFYHSIGMKDAEIDMIMPTQNQTVPMDPITENMNSLMGKPLVASIEQDHEAHIMTHMPYSQDPNMAAHIKQHESFKYLINMQMAMGIQMPDPQMLQDPQVQNQIALMAAQVTQQQMAQQQQQIESQQPIDPNQVMMADIAQRQQESQFKHEDARLKAETEAYKAQMDFEKEKMKIEANKEMSDDKNQKDLTIAEMKVY